MCSVAQSRHLLQAGIIMATESERRAIRRERNVLYVETIRSNTFCEECDAQPVEWHHDDHPLKPNSRVSSLMSQGVSIRRIQQEIDICEALCRSCHMAADGRTKKLQDAKPRQAGSLHVPPKPCIVCLRMTKPTRRGMCYKCYTKSRGIR